MMEEVMFYRHIIPSSLWKLQKWLNVGQEKGREGRGIFVHSHAILLIWWRGSD